MDILSILSLRSVVLFVSTAFSLMFVMLFLNIITVDDVVTLLKMSPESANAFKLIVSRIQEVSTNILNIISQLLNKLLSWAGVDVDLSKIKVDLSKTPTSASSSSMTAPASTPYAAPHR